MSGLLAMDGYAAFVWSSYFVSLVGLGIAIVATWLGYRSAQRRLASLENEKK